MPKLISLMLIIILVTSISGCISYVPILKVTTTIGGTTDAPIIESIEAEQGTALREPKGHPPSMPGVYVLVIKERMGNINYWTSVPYVGPGTYELTAGFRVAPSPGDSLRVLVQVVDERGDAIVRNETVKIWR